MPPNVDDIERGHKMSYINNGEHQDSPKELFNIYLTDGMLYDKLHRFAAEYSLPVEALVDLAVKRFTDDIELVRDLRSGRVEKV